MKNNLPKLTPRLALIASKVRKGKIICDIGTDHAYLPVFLVKSGISPFAIAADVRVGPLQKAKQTIGKYDAFDKVKTVLSNGFSEIDKNSFDDAIIAGMGGELIAEILKAAPFLKERDRTLILQPMTSAYELRKYLTENDFEILDEEIAKEDEKLYNVMVAKAGKTKNYSEIDFVFGKKLKKRNGELERLYLDKLINEYEKIIIGLEKGKLAEKAEKAKEILAALIHTKEQMCNGNCK
jgi:tRNA (adenine22-N1)-methyltransferase